jgi:hypothetical protein
VKRLTFSLIPGGWQRVAEHPATGLRFVITHLTGVPKDEPAYEIETSERGSGRTRVDYVHRLDTARALCERKVDDRLTGADQ